MARILMTTNKILMLNTIDKEEDFGDLLSEGVEAFWFALTKFVYETHKLKKEIVIPDFVLGDEYMTVDDDNHPQLEKLLGVKLTDEQIHEYYQDARIRMLLEVDYAKHFAKLICSHPEFLNAKDADKYTKKMRGVMDDMPQFYYLEHYNIADATAVLGSEERFKEKFQKYIDAAHFSIWPDSKTMVTLQMTYDEKEGYVYKMPE